MWLGQDVGRLFGVDPDELMRLSDLHRATGIAIGVDEIRLWAALKIRCGTDDTTLWLPQYTSLHMASACLAASHDHGWAYAGMVNDRPEIERADWDSVEANCVEQLALGTLDDAAILAATFIRTPREPMAFRLPSAFVAFAGALLEAIFLPTG